jgi:hypothetical protein
LFGLDAACGAQRLQGLKPALSADCHESKKRTLSRFGLRDAQCGRQYTPVVTTPYTNAPSACGSRSRTTFQRPGSEEYVSSFTGCLSHAVVFETACFDLRSAGLRTSRCSTPWSGSRRFRVSRVQTSCKGCAPGEYPIPARQLRQGGPPGKVRRDQAGTPDPFQPRKA